MSSRSSAIGFTATSLITLSNIVIVSHIFASGCSNQWRENLRTTKDLFYTAVLTCMTLGCITKTPATSVAERIDALINTLVAADQFSGVILVSRDDKPIYARAVGLASRAWNMPNRLDTKFNIASIGKMFTGVAVAQLVEQGKLSYDETLDKALPRIQITNWQRRSRLVNCLPILQGLPAPRAARHRARERILKPSAI